MLQPFQKHFISVLRLLCKQLPGIIRSTCRVLLKRMWGFIELHVGIYQNVLLNLTSCRGLADSITSPRRSSSEGSLAKCWGLGKSEQSKESFCSIKEKQRHAKQHDKRHGRRCLQVHPEAHLPHMIRHHENHRESPHGIQPFQSLLSLHISLSSSVLQTTLQS